MRSIVFFFKFHCFSLEKAWSLHLNTNKLNPCLSSMAVSLLQDFEYVFPDEVLNGLPPIRGIEHHIDLVPNIIIPTQQFQTN